MAEGRMLKKKISLDGRWADLKRDTHRLLFTVGIAHLDIEGRISGDPREFKAAVAPMLDHVTREEVLAFFKDAQGLGLIWRYQAEGRWVIQYPGFKKNQTLRPDKEAASQYPPPPENYDTPTHKDSGITPGELPEDSGTTPAEVKGSKINLSKSNLKASAFVTGKAVDASPAPEENFLHLQKFKPADLMGLWNELGCKPMVSELTDDRRKKAGLRLRKRGDPDWWGRLFEKVKALNKAWLTFDFLMKNDTNCLKVLEGNYDIDFKSTGGAREKPFPDAPGSGKYAGLAQHIITE